MPNIKSSKKNVLRSAERQLRNKSAKSAVKTAVKKSRAAIAAGNMEEAVKARPGSGDGVRTGLALTASAAA